MSAKERNETFAEEDALKSVRSQATTLENDFHQGFAEDLNMSLPFTWRSARNLLMP